MNRFTMPEQLPCIVAIPPQAGAAITGDYICLKNAHKVFAVVNINQANAATVAITIEKATAVAGTGSVAITEPVKIWANQDAAASDAMVRQTDTVSFTTSAATAQKKIIFEIDPAALGSDYDCITVKTAASNAANITQADYFVIPRYSQATPPSFIVD